MSASSRSPKRKAAEAAESKMAANVDQIDCIAEVLESKNLVDDGIDRTCMRRFTPSWFTSRWLVGMNTLRSAERARAGRLPAMRVQASG